MQLNSDFHIHSCFSMASSKKMTPESILYSCQIKGLDVIGSGDALHPVWRRMWEETDVSKDLIVVPTTEVEDINRVHHLIMMNEFSYFEELSEMLNQFSKNLQKNGRPRINCTGGEIAEQVHALGGLIGPAHAFTPWTSLYKSFDSVYDCYHDETIDFLELGLSADSSYGDGIAELSEVPFLTNSDAHSANPAKLGREFNRIHAKRNVSSVLEAVKNNKITLNVGFFPEEGKYNRTGCVRCFKIYDLEQAEKQNWKCDKCGGRIKKGVLDRALELSGPIKSERPPYLHIIPLAEIIQRVFNTSSPATKKCMNCYQEFISTFGNEISVLITVPTDELKKLHEGVGTAVDALRRGDVILHPGCGGRYGTFEIPI